MGPCWRPGQTRGPRAQQRLFLFIRPVGLTLPGRGGMASCARSSITKLFLFLHSRTGFWEGCNLEYVSSPPGGRREGRECPQDALPDGQSLRYYRVALCRLCVLAQCPRLARVFMIREIRPCGASSRGLLSDAQMLAAHLGELFSRRPGPPTEPPLDSLQVPPVISCSRVIPA